MIGRIISQLNKNDKLLKHSLVMFISGLLTGFLNYVFQLYMGRALGPVDYGTLDVLFSIFYVLVAPSGTIQTIITKFVSDYKAQDEYGKVRKLISYSFKRILIYGSIFLVVYIILSSYIAEFLNISRVSLVMLMGVVLLLSFMTPVMNGVLAGLQKFNWLAASGVVLTFTKLVSGVLLVMFGFGVYGAVNALNIAAVFGLLLPLIPIWFLFEHEKKEIDGVKIFKYGFGALIITTMLMLLTNIDMVLVKHYFSSLESGYYAAASMLAKIIWFASGALIAVMFPKISSMFAKGEDTSSLLKNTMFYTSLVSGSIIAIYFIAPNFVVHLLFGEQYKIAGLIGLFALGLGLFALNNVLVMYNLATNKFKCAYVLLSFLLMEILLIIFVHNSLIEVIKIVVVVNVLLFVSLLLYNRKELGFNGI